MTVTQIFESITKEMCDKYCKYPLQCENEEDLYKVCEHCPLNKL